MIRIFFITIYLIVVLIVGFFISNLFANMIHHRYYDGDFGSYFGAVNGSFHLHELPGPTAEINFSGETEPEWYWYRPNNFQYQTIKLNWEYWKKNGTLEKNRESGELNFPSLTLNLKDKNLNFTLKEYCKTCLGFPLTELSEEKKTIVKKSYHILISAGQGKLPRPQHHSHRIQEVGAYIQHFSLGYRYSYLSFFWVIIWIWYIKKRLKATNPIPDKSEIHDIAERK